MKTKYEYVDDAMFVSTEDAIELLKKGHSLTCPNRDMDTIRKKGEYYYYMGKRDQGPTIFDEEELRKSKLFWKKRWILDLL